MSRMQCKKADALQFIAEWEGRGLKKEGGNKIFCQIKMEEL